MNNDFDIRIISGLTEQIKTLQTSIYKLQETNELLKKEVYNKSEDIKDLRKALPSTINRCASCEHITFATECEHCGHSSTR